MKLLFVPMLMASALWGCQTMEAKVPAALSAQSDAAMARITQKLSEIEGRAQIELMHEDLTATSSISVLPPRPTDLEGRSLARPTTYELMLDESGACWLVRRDDGDVFPMNGVDCVAL